MSLLKYSQVEQFIEVCRYQNVTQAAKNLFISQQALSQSIRKLEGDLGCKLFHRISHGIQLTESGTQVYEMFDPVVRAYQDAELQINIIMQHKSPGQTLSFAVGPGIIRSITPELILSFCELNPGLKLDVVEMSDRQIEQYIHADKARFGILDVPEWLHEKQNNYIVLQRAPTYLLAPKNHPFAALPCVSLAALKNERVLSLSEGSYYLTALNKVVAQYGFTITPYFESSDIIDLAGMVNRGVGVLLCARDAYEESALDDCVLISLLEREFDSCMTCMFQEFTALDPISQKFIRYLQENIN